MILRSLLALALVVATPHSTARISTGSNPCGAASAADGVWVANDGSGTLARIDARTNRVTRRINVGRGACEVAAGFGALWVTNYKTGTVLRVDLRTYRVRRVAVGSTPFDVAAAGGRVWATAWGDGTLAEIDPTSFRVVRRIAVGAFPTALLFQGGALWVGFGRDATDVARIDPASGRIERIAVGVKAPSHFLATSNGIWLTNDGDALVHLDPATRTVLGTTHFGRTLVQPAAARDGTLWVPDKEVDTIFRVNPATGRVLDSFAGGNGAYNALRAFGSMWVTSYAGADVWRFKA